VRVRLEPAGRASCTGRYKTGIKDLDGADDALYVGTVTEHAAAGADRDDPAPS